MMYLKLYGGFNDRVVPGGDDPDLKWWRAMFAVVPAAVAVFLSSCKMPMDSVDITDIPDDERLSDVIDVIKGASYTVTGANKIAVDFAEDKSGIMFYLSKLRQTYPNIPGDLDSITIPELNIPDELVISVFDKDYNINDAIEIRSQHERSYYFATGYSTLDSGPLEVSFLQKVNASAWNNYSVAPSVTVAASDGNADGLEETLTVTFPGGENKYVGFDLTGRTTAAPEDDDKSFPSSNTSIGIVDLDTQIDEAVVIIGDKAYYDEVEAAKDGSRPVNRAILEDHGYQTEMILPSGNTLFQLDMLPLSVNIWLDGSASISEVNSNHVEFSLPANGENFVAYPFYDPNSINNETVSLTDRIDILNFSFDAGAYENMVSVVLIDTNKNSVSHFGLNSGSIVLKDFLDVVGVSTVAGETAIGDCSKDGTDNRAVIALANNEKTFLEIRKDDETMIDSIDASSTNIKFTIHTSGGQDLEQIMRNIWPNFKVESSTGQYRDVECNSLYDLVSAADQPLLAGSDSYELNTTLFEISMAGSNPRVISGSFKMNLMEFINESGAEVEFKISGVSIGAEPEATLFNFDWNQVKAAGIYYNDESFSISDFKLGREFVFQNSGTAFKAIQYGENMNTSQVQLLSISTEEKKTVSFSVDRGDGESVDMVVEPSDSFDMGPDVYLCSFSSEYSSTPFDGRDCSICLFK